MRADALVLDALERRLELRQGAIDLTESEVVVAEID